MQFASRRHPLFGDQRYGQNVNKVINKIHYGHKLEIIHPTTKENGAHVNHLKISMEFILSKLRGINMDKYTDFIENLW